LNIEPIGPRLRAKIRSVLLTRASFLFAALMLANVIAYLYHMLAARMMTPADYGVMVTLTSISYLLDVMVRTVQAAVTKTVASVAGDAPDRVHDIFDRALRVLLPIAALAFVSISAGSGHVAKYLHLSSPIPVVLLGLYASLHFLGPLPRGILLGLGRLRKASIVLISEPTVRLIVGVTLVGLGMKANGALAGFAVGAMFAFLVAMLMIRNQLAGGRNAARTGAFLTGFDRYAILVLLVNSFLMVMASIDQVVIKRYFSPEIAGNYAVTFVIGRVILLTAISLGVVIFTRSVTLQGSDRRRLTVLAKGMMIMAGIAAATMLVTLGAPALIVRLVAGSQYGIAKSFIGLVGIEMSLFALTYIQVYYHISINNMKVLWPLLIATIAEITLLAIFHGTVQQVLMILIAVTAGLLVVISGFTWADIRRARKADPVLVRR
jgi:O-antigen/teichoic acid export membrane protein